MNGRNIVKYRDDNGLSQIELAKRLKIAKSTLSHWENNKSTPRGSEYERLVSVIGEDYISDEDLTEEKTAVRAIEEMSDRVNDILYQVSNIESAQRQHEIEEKRMKRIHRIIRTTAVIVTCVLILLLALGTWFYIMNYGFRGEVKEGPVEIGKPSYYTVEDLSDINTDNQ